MNNFWRQYPFWFFVGNWLVTSCVLFVIFQRLPETQSAFHVLDFKPVVEQSSLLVFVLIIAVAIVIARAYSAFLAFMSSYNIDEDSFAWLSEDEYSQQEKQKHRLHMRLLFSLLLTLAVFSLHYLVGLFIAGAYALTIYTLSSWLIGLACILLLRRGYKLPLLSTYEYATKNRLIFYSVIMLLASVLTFATLVFTVLRQQQSLCTGLLECLWDNITDLPKAFDAWLFSLLSYDWLIQGLMLLFFLSTVRLWRTLDMFRAKVLESYKQVILISILALLALLAIDFIVDEQYIWFVLGYSFFSLTSYIGIFLLRDVPRLKPKDSVVHRPEVLKAMMKDVFVK